MRKINLEDGMDPIDVGRLLEFEAKIRCPLPPAYREFLIQTNGGQPATCNNSISVCGRPEFNPEVDRLDVDLFYPINDQKYPNIELSDQFAVLESRIPLATIPIARTAFGDKFLIAVRGPHLGRIYFWDHESEGFSPPADRLHNVAELYHSFEEFLEGLEPEQELLL